MKYEFTQEEVKAIMDGLLIAVKHPNSTENMINVYNHIKSKFAQPIVEEKQKIPTLKEKK